MKIRFMISYKRIYNGTENSRFCKINICKNVSKKTYENDSSKTKYCKYNSNYIVVILYMTSRVPNTEVLWIKLNINIWFIIQFVSFVKQLLS